MSNKEIFERYIQIADALGQMFKNVLELTIQEGNTTIYTVNKISSAAKKKSTVVTIKDDEGKNIGSFCINFDISQFEQFQKFLEFFIEATPEPQSQEIEIQEEIDHWLLEKGLFVKQLSYKDKKAVVQHLHKKGCFKKRGALSTIANHLQLTRQCIYNYLEK